MAARPQSRGCGKPTCPAHGIGKCCPCYDPESMAQLPWNVPCFDRCCVHNRGGHPFVAVSGLGATIWVPVDALAHRDRPIGEARACSVADRREY